MEYVFSHENVVTESRDPTIYPRTIEKNPLQAETVEEMTHQVDENVIQSKYTQYQNVIYSKELQQVVVEGVLYDIDKCVASEESSWSQVFILSRVSDNRAYVLKLMRQKYISTSVNNHSRFCNEVLYQQIANLYGVAPTIMAYGWCCLNEPTYFILMIHVGEPIVHYTKQLYDKVYSQFCILLTVANIQMSDIHQKNILYESQTDRVSLIDFDPGCTFNTVSFVTDDAQKSIYLDHVKQSLTDIINS